MGSVGRERAAGRTSERRGAVEATPVAHAAGDKAPAPPPSPERCQSPQLYDSPASPSQGVLSSTSPRPPRRLRGAWSRLRPHSTRHHAQRVCRVPRVLCARQACLSQQVLGSMQEQSQETDSGQDLAGFLCARIHCLASGTQPRSCLRISCSVVRAGGSEELLILPQGWRQTQRCRIRGGDGRGAVRQGWGCL